MTNEDMTLGLERVLSDGRKVGDVVVSGKPLRDWRVDDLESAAAFGDFEMRVWAAFPKDPSQRLGDLLGEEFETAFYGKRSKMIEAEEGDRQRSKGLELARRIFKRDDVRLIAQCAIAHVGWEMDNLYWAFEVDGARRYVGTDHGSAVEVEEAEIEGYLHRARKAVEEIEVLLGENASTLEENSSDSVGRVS